MIATTVEERLTVLTLDRPEKRNALGFEGLAALETAVEAAETPVLCLRGAGPAFCAGADLATVAELDAERAREFARRGQRVASAIETSKTVVVAAIDGAARGGGVELALACDVRVATPEATFAETGVTLGLFGAWGGTVRLPRIVGAGHALDLALSGRVVDAETALGMGLVSRIDENPETVAHEVAANDRAALRRLKSLMHERGTVAERERAEREAFSDLVESAPLGED